MGSAADYSKSRTLIVLLVAMALMALSTLSMCTSCGCVGSMGKGVAPGGSGSYSYNGGIIIELQGKSWSTHVDERDVQGTNGATRQAYKFKTAREGEDFHYFLAGLADTTYSLELSFVEYANSAPGERVFAVTCNGSSPPGLSPLDLCAVAGAYRAHQVTIPDVSAPGGTLDLRFQAANGLALVSHIRLSSPVGGNLEIDAGESRQWTFLPLRFSGTPDQDVCEVVLGRLGSRFMINPVPQLLAWRQSPLGARTDDLSELVLAFKDEDGDIRCLPFTDRYPVFSSIHQVQTLTGVEYHCSDPSLPFQVNASLKAPFYPGDVKLSTAPFFYLEIEISNPGDAGTRGQFLMARPHKDDNTGKEAPRPLEGPYRGYKYIGRYTYGEESRVLPAGDSDHYQFWESVAVDNPDGVNWHFLDIASTSWIWDSPPGYPKDRPSPSYTFIPRGYSGFDAPFALDGQARQTRTTVLACHSAEGVLEVLGNPNYRFLYGKPSGPNLGSVDRVVDYALGRERPAIEEKTSFFNGALSDAFLQPFPQAGRDLAACALQSFICNTWWCYDGPSDEWFSVWEGESYTLHSSVDVEYSNAWFYLYFWPDLLGTLLREWTLFEKDSGQGKYLSHDMGAERQVKKMAYPHDMPVEENADFILLLFAFWKSTGDTAFMRGEFEHAVDYTEFLFACDGDLDGFPDLHAANTVDQGSPAVQNSRNQTYLGVKALAAYRAASEMARAQDSPGAEFISGCEERMKRINLTLEGGLWLGDHFAVCSDPSVAAVDRNAYSVYTSNGLLYLLSSGCDTGLTPANLERVKQDLSSAASATARRYGSVHTSVNNENQWVSQDLWRDALGYFLKVDGWAAGQEDRLSRYWELERYFATRKNGGFWDVCAYNPGRESRDGAGRGAFPPDHAYDQCLGYYARGVAVFSLLGALGRLGLDRASGSLSYDPPQAPCRIPVFSCADWGAKDHTARIPVLVCDDSGALREALNPQLLPEGFQFPSP